MKPTAAGRAGGDAAAKPEIDLRPGLAQATLVLTLDGALPVEFLTPGDRIITRDSGMAVLREIRSRQLARPAILIRAGTLGHDRPDHDTLVSPDQMLLIRDWRAKAMFGTAQALVPISRLMDGEHVLAADVGDLRVFELIFDRPHIVYANGLEVASTASERVVA